jgi:hypothetical protein
MCLAEGYYTSRGRNKNKPAKEAHELPFQSLAPQVATGSNRATSIYSAVPPPFVGSGLFAEESLETLVTWMDMAWWNPNVQHLTQCAWNSGLER